MSYFLRQIWTKISATFFRLVYFIRTIPLRFLRLFHHIWSGLLSLQLDNKEWWQSWLKKSENIKRLFWCFALLLLFLDLFGIGEWYDTITDWLNFRSRTLSPHEIEIAKGIFGESLHYPSIRLDERALLGPKQFNFAYVSINTINCWSGLPNSVLVHELVHVWQYRRFGSAYIAKALYAQTTEAAYNYGGTEALYKAHAQDFKLWEFNFEQMADIVADYYRIKEGYLPKWGTGIKQDLAVYEHFVKQLKNTRFYSKIRY